MPAISRTIWLHALACGQPEIVVLIGVVLFVAFCIAMTIEARVVWTILPALPDSPEKETLRRKYFSMSTDVEPDDG